jgi:hypothetical protein
MAVELGLNRYVAHPPVHETEFQMRERRNRERTYLVLFVHDRSLSMQTGRHWMLPEVRSFTPPYFPKPNPIRQDDLVRRSITWHEQGGATIRQEDVIVAAFVQLRCIAVRFTTSSPFDPHHSSFDRPKRPICSIPRKEAPVTIMTSTTKSSFVIAMAS